MSIEECLAIDFEVIDMDNIMMIKDYLEINKFEESNHNLVNMILWMKWYPLFYVKHDNYLILLGVHEGEMFIYMPLCKDEYLKEALDCAKKIFEHYHTRFVLSCFIEEQMLKVKKILPNIEVIDVRESYDYVYSVESLKTFKGKKLQKKRNHLNYFYANYDYQYEHLNKDNVLECIEFLKQWKDDTDDDFLIAEKEGTFRILQLFGKLEYKGGLIRIDGKVKAFAIGSVLSDRMCQENIEKADDSYRGLYQAIIQQFLQNEFSDFEYVNREDDMGKENIRHAKEAYNPCFMIKKYKLVEV